MPNPRPTPAEREDVFRREITFSAAYDKRHPDPSKNYGLHGVNMRWLLIGPKGAIQFLVFTGWQLPGIDDTDPMAADIGYHSPVPMYEGQKPMGKCDVLAEGDCYYDGSPLNAEPVFELLRTGGSDAVWARMEEEYRNRFAEESPDA